MNPTLVATLKKLKADPTAVLELYPQLYSASFLALVQRDSERSVEPSSFLTYTSSDGVRELPIFTQQEYMLSGMPEAAVIVELNGVVLWRRLLDVIVTGVCEAAVDPGQPHGIRLTREMVLSTVMQHSPSNGDSYAS